MGSCRSFLFSRTAEVTFRWDSLKGVRLTLSSSALPPAADSACTSIGCNRGYCSRSGKNGARLPEDYRSKLRPELDDHQCLQELSWPALILPRETPRCAGLCPSARWRATSGPCCETASTGCRD